ncbi:MAG: glycosyltransferase family 2 protein [Cellvibrionaceae bacterium]|nr:glycosyltransferase family 2 protein [Cellvibrionaceae bacterium]
MIFLIVISWVLSLLSFVLALSFLIEILATVVASRAALSGAAVDLKRPAAILIPAHNEEDVIAATLSSVMHQLQPEDEVVVIADNCTDNTAEIARSFGVTVLARHSLTHKGKGYALAYGLNYLKTRSVDCVIMLDADCLLEDAGRDCLLEQVLLTAKPVQSLYLMQHKGGELSVSKKVSEFAWLIKNKLRPLGLKNLGGPCQLMGTGMAFPVPLIYNTELASGCIVEDMKLGLDLALAGQAPKFTLAAGVVSYFPESTEVSEGQKSRWVQGHMQMIVQYAPRLLLKFLKTGDIQRLLMALDLLIPPLMLFLVMSLVVFMFSAVVALLVGGSVSLYLAALAMVFLIAGIYFSWLFEGRNIISGRELLSGVLQLLKKFSVYTQVLTDKRREWNKTSRK